MPELNENYGPDDLHMLEGKLLNEYAERLNRLMEAESEWENFPSNVEIGIFELITNHPDFVYDAHCNHLNSTEDENGQTTYLRDPDGLPVIDTLNGRWYGRFVYIRDGKAYVEHLWATIDTKLYSFADLSKACVPFSSATSAIESGDPTTGMIPEFAPFDKIPCIHFLQTGKMIPFVGPPEELPYYVFYSTLGDDFNSKPLTGVTALNDLPDVGKVVAMRLEWYDPRDQSWKFDRDRVAYAPISAFGVNGNTQLTLTTSQPILMVHGCRLKVTAAYVQDLDEDISFSVVHASFKVKCLGRHWQTNYNMFLNGHTDPITEKIVVNDYDYRRAFLRPSWSRVLGTLWTELENWRGDANTRKRYRDTPEPLSTHDHDDKGSPYVEFEIKAKNGEPWYWTADVTSQITVRLVDDGTCPKIPGVDFNDLPIVPADEIDYVLAIKDNCLVKVEVDECPDPDA